MAANNDIFSNEWCDLIFIGKNQDYGAYELRRNSVRRHFRALLIATILFVLAITGPGLLKSILPAKHESDTTVRTLTDIQLDKPKEQENIIKDIPPPPPVRNTIKFTPPVIKPDEMVAEEDEPKMQKEVVEQKAAIGAVDFDKGTNDIDAPIAKKEQEIVQADEKPFINVEQMPEYPGGTKEMMKFITNNLKYPVIASEMGVQGNVIVQFVVGRDGKIGSIKVLRGIGSGCDEEAIRVLQKMPAWNPGRQGGKPVLVFFTLPFRFVLSK
jgi:periplasmic protein TonB